MPRGATNLAELAGSGLLSGAAAQQRTIAMLPAFEELLRQAVMQRGSVVECAGSAAVSLALALAAGPSLAGAWVGVAGLPQVGVAAAVELGVAPERLVMVAEPAQRFDDGQWAEVLAAMIDGFDVLLLGPGAHAVKAVTARRLVARLQSRGAVLLSVMSTGGAPGVFGADLRFEAMDAVWQGLGDGHGVARGRRASVQLSGRRVPRPRRAEMWLPTADGAVEAVVSITGAVEVAVAGAVEVAVGVAVAVEVGVGVAASPAPESIPALRRTG